MHILSLPVIEHQSAVGVILQRHAFPGEQLQHDAAAHIAQVAGEDQVIVPGYGAGVPEHCLQGVEGRRCHGRAHVGHVRHTQIHDASPGHMGDIRSLRLGPQNAAPRRRGRPLGSRRTLAAVGQRHPILPLRRAEVGGGLRRRHTDRAGGHGHSGQRQCLPHSRAGPIYPVEGNIEIPQAKRSPNVLVQQIPGEGAVHVLRRQPALLQGQTQGIRLHLCLALFPGLFPTEGVRPHSVEAAAQRPLALQLSRHRRKADHSRRLQKPAGLPAQALHIHDTHLANIALTVVCTIYGKI